ncbi:MAG: PRC-barrel domain-containing protein [Candidatus Bathyarchaeia archaeon]|jgi:sporulation protein YlmC with PRC-barrel domain
MRALEELLGKLIVDSKGNEVGKIDDVEVDLNSKLVEAIVVKGKGILAKQFQAEKLASLMKRLRITKTEDLLIPFDEVQAIGKYVVLKSGIDQANEPPTPS